MVNDFSNIWGDKKEVANVPESDWMKITTTPGISISANKVYPVSMEDRQLINCKFDKMHANGKMEWTSKATPHAYPIFVVGLRFIYLENPPNQKLV